jgi:acetyl esterase/lipase
MKRSLCLPFYFFIISTMLVNQAVAQTSIPLYEHEVPNSKPTADEEESTTGDDGILRISKVTRPMFTIYLPSAEKANWTAVIIFPGGGYGILAASHEGSDVAKRLNEMGITAFVVKYRLPSDKIMLNKEIGPLQDAQRAIQLVRENAKKWKIKENKIGIMGFSAGGHLASTAGTHFDKSYIDNPKKTSLRPDFLVLGYPVINLTDSLAHLGSRNNLLGQNPSAEKIKEYSNDMQVNANTPPTFLVHAKDDGGVKVANTLLFEAALKKNNVPVEVYLYEKGGHGFGMINKTSDVRWMDLLQQWMVRMNFLGN